MNDAATVTTTSDAQLLGEVLRHALDGIAVVETRDGITRVAYGNATLAALLRRSEDWVAGHRLEDVEVESITTMNAAANTGATFCSPFSLAISRVWRRS